MRFYLSLLFCFLAFALKAQNVLITTVNTDQLSVCGTDTFHIQLSNTGSSTLTGLNLVLTLPLGISYVPGTVNGLVEQNLSNLNQPEFSLATFNPGSIVSVRVLLSADCALVGAINSGQLFNNQVQVTYPGGADQVVSLSYAVETGLVVIASVNQSAAGGELGDTLLRTIKVRNTRLGPIRALSFSDQHYPGYDAQLLGAVQEVNGPVLYRSVLPGSFFTAFGNGDTLFQFNEELTLIERVIITDCGTPSFDNPSIIRIGWGCGVDQCQYDSVDLLVSILPSTQNPLLRFEGVYQPPVDFCASLPATNILRVINDGELPAQNVFLDVRSGLGDSFSGMDPASFEYNAGAGWLPIAVSLVTNQELPDCGATYLSRAAVILPEVPAKDTVLLRYQYFTCFPECKKGIGVPFVFTFYRKACPETATVTDSIPFVVDSTSLAIQHFFRLNFNGCMEEGQSYPVEWVAVSPRFLTDTGFYQVKLQLPSGLVWDPSCIPTIGGMAPVFMQVDPGQDPVLSFPLPFTNDTVDFQFCLQFVCGPGLGCTPLSTDLPQEGGSTTVFPQACLFACKYEVHSVGRIVKEAEEVVDCGLSSCYDFPIIVKPECGSGGGGLPCTTPLIGVSLDYRTYRTNYGWLDADDNRIMDAPLPADSAQIRLDRYIPGDTLRFELEGRILVNSFGDVPLRVFTESLASDAGLLDGDEIDVVAGRTIFTHKDSLGLVRAWLRVKRLDGEEYSCEAPVIDYLHQNYVQVQAVNIEPPLVIDRLVTMNRRFLLKVQSCAPDGLPLSIGDSLFFTYEYVFLQNYRPSAAGSPPPALVNFRNIPWDGGFAWTTPELFGFHRPLSQYSGYHVERGHPRHTTRACATSFQQMPFSYSIRLARGNLFPYELRPIAAFQRLEYSLPLNIDPQLITSNLVLQEAINWIQNEPTPWTRDTTQMKLDLQSGIFETPVDEGFELTTHFQYAPSCSFYGPDTARFSYDIEYPDGFPGASLQTVDRIDPLGYIDALPRLKLELAQTNINLSASDFALNFNIRNLRPAEAPNAWLYLEPLNGTLTGLDLQRMPGGVSQPMQSNLFQLGTIGFLANIPFLLKGVNSNCDALKLRVILGWDCSSVSNPLTNSCGRDTILLDLRLNGAVLELNVISQPMEVPLCAASDYFVVEVSNANDGNAMALTASIKLPEGMSVLAGSAQVQYPSPGGTWTSILDPQLSTGNVYFWEMGALLPSLVTGLPGFEAFPANTFRLRFKTIAACSVVANAQPVYGVSGVQPCGTFTNSLRKPGDPVGLEGLTPAYGVDISLSPLSSSPVSCGEELVVAVQLLLQGTPSLGDSIYLLLPDGVDYVMGSYVPGQNAPGSAPQLIGRVLQWPLSAGLGAGEVIKFNLRLLYEDAASCLDQFVVVQTRQQVSGFCPLTNQTCGVYLSTGEALMPIPTANPDLKISDFVFTGTDPSGAVGYSITVDNPGMVAAQQAIVQLWLDVNGNGLPDNNDVLAQSISMTSAIPGGSSYTQSGSLAIPLEALCQLLLVLPAAENCSCAPKYFPISGNPRASYELVRCAVQPVSFGVPLVNGHSYTWINPSNLSCTACAETTFQPGGNVQQGDAFTFLLQENTGDCIIEHAFTLRFISGPGIEGGDLNVCKGDSILLQATPGGIYQWAGGGQVSTLAQWWVTPEVTTSYQVTVTLPDGCVDSSSILVKVLDAVQVDLGVVQICPGQVATILGVPQTNPGVYCIELAQQNGCDSTVCQRLEWVPVASSSSVLICPGDSVEVFPGQVEGSAGQYCKVFQNQLGCDSTHCTAVALAEPVDVPLQDTLYVQEGDSIWLTAPLGLAWYYWEEQGTALNCSNCQQVQVAPTSATTYTLIVRNEAGCGDTVEYRVVVYPPCFEELNVPNAFTPDGDGVNDVLRLVPFEGLDKAKSLQVYNRWGQKIYQSSTHPSWDGTVGGKPAPPDVYLYILDVECNGVVFRLPQREVTLIR